MATSPPPSQLSPSLADATCCPAAESTSSPVVSTPSTDAVFSSPGSPTWPPGTAVDATQASGPVAIGGDARTNRDSFALPEPHDNGRTVWVLGLTSHDWSLEVDRLSADGRTHASQEHSSPGGMAANTAVALARLTQGDAASIPTGPLPAVPHGQQWRVALLSRVGEDASGAFVSDRLARCGLDLRYFSRVSGHHTPRAVCIASEGGAARSIIGVQPGEVPFPAAQWPLAQLEAVGPHLQGHTRPAGIHTDGWYGACSVALLAAARSLPQPAVTSYDAGWLTTHSPAIAAHADVLFVSHAVVRQIARQMPELDHASKQPHERQSSQSSNTLGQRGEPLAQRSEPLGDFPSMSWIAPAVRLSAVVRWLRQVRQEHSPADRGQPLWIGFTNGLEGSVGVELLPAELDAEGDDATLTRLVRQRLVHAPAAACQLVDSTGAGDAFHAALFHQRLCGASLPQAMRLANVVAAMACEALGAQASLPTLPAALERMGQTAPATA